jgi:hypothetical protein
MHFKEINPISLKLFRTCQWSVIVRIQNYNDARKIIAVLEAFNALMNLSVEILDVSVVLSELGQRWQGQHTDSFSGGSITCI